MMQFDLPQERPSIIKVIGVGGGGSNAVNHMYKLGIEGVDFIVSNTDLQALEMSPVPIKIQLGPGLTEGRGAGAIPEVGKHAAIENIDEIRAILTKNTRMVFITAGMGGGTGTGAAPIIAGLARELGILTVAIVTVPFAYEGKKRKKQADDGIEELKKQVDTLLVICNDKLREIHGNLKISDAFGHADDILAVAAKSIAEIITKTLHINVDFADVQTVMKDSGVAIMGAGVAEGENRALEAVKKALDSPLLNDNEITGARYILLNITSGNEELSMDEMGEINEFVQEKAGQTAEVIMGVGADASLGNKISVTIIATGFKTRDQLATVIVKEEPKVKYDIQGNLISVEKVLVTKNDVPGKVEAPESVNKTVEPSRDPMHEMFSFIKPVAVDTPPEISSMERNPFFSAMRNPFVPQPKAEANGVDTNSESENQEIIPAPRAYQPVEKMVVINHTQEVQEEKTAIENSALVTVEEPAQELQQIHVLTLDEFELTATKNDVPEAAVSESPVSESIAPVPEMEAKDNEFIFDVDSHITSETDIEEPVVDEITDSETDAAVNTPVVTAPTPSPSADQEEDPYRNARERLAQIREVKFKSNTPSEVADMEKVPAYIRRNVTLDQIPPSKENNISRFTLSQDKDNRPEIKGNNPYLHDRVD